MYSFFGSINDGLLGDYITAGKENSFLGSVGESIENDNRKPHVHVQFLELKRPQDRFSPQGEFNTEDVSRILDPKDVLKEYY